jgi:hypothetical protein
MDIVGRIWATILFLRQELRDLKRCQVQYFTVSITATGVLLGLASTLATPENRGLAVLSPLGLLLPCWMVFFDKATTITRIVGYQRILERLMDQPPGSNDPKIWFLGFETAVARFRSAQDRGKLVVNAVEYKPSFLRVLLLRTRHRFWMLNWYTFFVLSLLCCGLGYNFLPDKSFTLMFPFIFRAQLQVWMQDFGTAAFLLTLLVAVWTLVVVLHLVRGSYSYDANARAWELLRILDE